MVITAVNLVRVMRRRKSVPCGPMHLWLRRSLPALVCVPVASVGEPSGGGIEREGCGEVLPG